MDAQQLSLIEDEDLGIAFCADSQWTRVSSDGNEYFEFENKNHNLNVIMWREKSAKSPTYFLEEMIKQQSLASDENPFELLVDGKLALAAIGNCNEMRRPKKVLLIAVPTIEGYYMIRFKCPAECFREHRRMMSELVNAIRLVETLDPGHYFTSRINS